jgi:hypothetical protein
VRGKTTSGQPSRGCGEPHVAGAQPDRRHGCGLWPLAATPEVVDHRHLRLGTLLSVVGRHHEKTRTQPEGDDDAPVERSAAPSPARFGDRLRANTGAVLLVTGLVLTAVALAGFGATRHHTTESAARTKESQGPGGGAPERPMPRTYPTRGELVPPAPATPKTTTTPTPTLRATRTSSGPPRSRSERRCPGDWRQFPPLREWCERNGYRTD